MRILSLIVVLALTLSACNKPPTPTPPVVETPVLTAASEPEPETLPGNAAIAEQAIPQFHMAINDARFDEIYKNASPELKKRKTQQAFVAQVEAVHRQLGAIQGTDRQSWRSEEQFPSTLVTLTFKSAYAAGEAIEEFLFRVEDQRAALAGYSIQSSVLKPK